MYPPRELTGLENEIIKAWSDGTPFDTDDLTAAYILGGFSWDNLRLCVTIAARFNLGTVTQAAEEMKVI